MSAGPIRRLVVVAAVCGGCCSGPRAEPAPPPRFDAALQRPLFSPTRRPPPAVPAVPPVFAAPPSPAPVLPPDIALSGIIAGGGRGVALLRRPQDAAPIRVALGGQIDGWTVAEIRARAIVLRRDARSVTVELPTR